MAVVIKHTEEAAKVAQPANVKTMSKETEMTKIEFLILHKPGTTDTIKTTHATLKEKRNFFNKLLISQEIKALQKLSVEKKYKDMSDMLIELPNPKIVNILLINPVKSNITDVLLQTCISNEVDIIIITGNVESIECQYANEAIETVSEELSTKLKNLITRMEKAVEKITHYKITCGICNKKLLINLSGTHQDKKECFLTISDMVVDMIYFIHEDELSNVAGSSNNDLLEQKKDTGAIENVEKEDSLDSLTDSIDDKLISIEEAMFILNNIAYDDIGKKGFETVNISDAYGRIALQNIYSKCNVPPFRTSSKHGYAVLAEDGNRLRKVLERKTNFPSIPLQSGTCLWVNSGAPIPEGTTAVVQVKDTKSVEDEDSKYIEIMIKPIYGQNIKIAGYDVMKDKLIINKFRRIGPEEMGLLALSGYETILVAKEMSIGVLSIGDNLEEPGEPLKPGFVYDINRISLISLLKHHGYSSLDLGIVNNKVSSIQEKIEEVLKDVNILVTTGCVNDKDLLKNILMENFNAKIHFGNVNIKPGKSTTLASCKIDNETKYFLCLSGNPTSAFITAHLFLVYFLNKLNCNIQLKPVEIWSQIEDSYLLHHRPRLAWTSLQWCNTEHVAKATNTSNLYSDKLCDIVGSNALLLLPKKRKDTQLLSNSTVPALIVDYPKNFDSQLSK